MLCSEEPVDLIGTVDVQQWQGRTRVQSMSRGDERMELTKKKLIAILVAAFLAGGVPTAGVGSIAVLPKARLGYVSMPKDEYNSMKSTYEHFGKAEQLYGADETTAITRMLINRI